MTWRVLLHHSKLPQPNQQFNTKQNNLVGVVLLSVKKATSRQPMDHIYVMQPYFFSTRINMEDNLSVFENGRQTQFFEKGRQPQFCKPFDILISRLA
jgi:hypothetical protein